MGLFESSSTRSQRAEQAANGLPAFSRAEHLAMLETDTFDMLIIGGGITGAYAAFDAALRGYRVALVEQGDFASGTSSKSSKMIHGGLRYIQQGNLPLVRRSLAERQRLRINAPHLVQRLPFIFPIMSSEGVFDRRLELGFAALLRTYDLAGGWREGILHKALTRDEVLTHAPTLRPQQLLRGYMYYDARADDARLTLAVARSAAAHGATLVNYAKATAMTRARGTVTGAVLDLDDREVRIRSSVVVMATGSWLRDWSGASPDTDAPTIRPAKGVHVAVPWVKVQNDSTITVPIPGASGAATITRWGDTALIGTTDEDYPGPLDDVVCSAAERDVLLHAVSAAFDSDVGAEDVTGSIAGTRPLISRGSETRTSEVSRSHSIRVDPDGLVTVVGGKLTTARHMAEQVIDAAERVLSSRRRSRTSRSPLVGAAGYDAQATIATGGLAAHLAERFGTEARYVTGLLIERPELQQAVVNGLPYVDAEVVHAVRHEMAVTIDDVLARRTRIRLYARDASARAAAHVGELMAAELGWSAEHTAAQVHAYRAAVLEERTRLDT